MEKLYTVSNHNRAKEQPGDKEKNQKCAGRHPYCGALKGP